MKIIDDLIRDYEHPLTDETDIYIKAKLKMINSLYEEIQGSEDRIYIEEIISKFAEIIDCQNLTIGSLLTDIAAAEGFGPTEHKFITTNQINLVSSHPYTPPEGGFQKDEQIKKAFSNYLTYHVNRKTKKGKDKPYSIYTIYDYCSRIKVLWEIAYNEWQANNRDGQLHLDEENILTECTFLNAYHNVHFLKTYVEIKDNELREIAAGHREPISAEETEMNPLNNPRNLGNTIAALMKFEEFKENIDEQQC